MANGGNADLGDLNWVHYVHAAFEPVAFGLSNRLKVAWKHRRYVAEERQALARARLVICNSHRTADDVVRLAGVARERTRVVYYGIEPTMFGPVDGAEREASRRTLGLSPERRLALFVGALGDRRKGFDTLFGAWQALCRREAWDVDLVVAGAGAELDAWKARAARELPEGRMRFLGFRRDMPVVFAACDVLIHPARYEAYGLGVHEALCRGLPAIVTADCRCRRAVSRRSEFAAAAGSRERDRADSAPLYLARRRDDCRARRRLRRQPALAHLGHMAHEIAELGSS